MKELGITFRVVETEHSDEKYPADLSGGAIALYLAEHKSESYTKRLESKQILLTADTIVWHGEKELGKPADREEAVEMLMLLSGDTHQVFTGVCLRSAEAQSSFYAVTDVTFSRLSSEEIEHYVDRYRPFDKAGAYGIQGKGAFLVKTIEGSYSNVVGLPLHELLEMLRYYGVIVPCC